MNRIISNLKEDDSSEDKTVDSGICCAFIPDFKKKDFSNPNCPFVGDLKAGKFTYGRWGQKEGLPMVTIIQEFVAEMLDSVHRHSPQAQITLNNKTFKVPITVSDAVKNMGKGCRACIKTARSYVTNEMDSSYIKALTEFPKNRLERSVCPDVENDRVFLTKEDSLSFTPQKSITCFGKIVSVYDRNKFRIHFQAFDGENINVVQHEDLIQEESYNEMFAKDERNLGGCNLDIVVKEKCIFVDLKDKSGKFGVLKFQDKLLPLVISELQTYFKAAGFREEDIIINTEKLSKK